MIGNIFAFLKFLIFVALMFVAIRYGGSVSLGEATENSVSIHIAVVVFGCGVICYCWKWLKSLFRNIFLVFHGKSNQEKGLDNLQRAFSSMLLRDASTAATFIKKSQKYLGNIPIVSWLEGQLSLINNDEHKAKSIFYGLSEREKGTAFGAHSLWQIAIKNKSDSDALNAISAMLEVSSNIQDLILQAIAISVRNKNFHMAKKHLSSIRKYEKSKLIEAIVCSEEGIATQSVELVRKAFKLAPELSNNAIFYAEQLMKEKEYRKARHILQKSFEKYPIQEVFDKYISCGNDLSGMDKIKFARKLINTAPESWIGYFGLAKLATQEDMLQSAFQNLLIAYEKEQYDFIANELVKVAKKLNNPKLLSAIEVLSKPLKSKHVTFVWKCAGCGAEENSWTSVCRCCNKIAEYHLEAVTTDNKLLLKPNNFEDF